MMGDDGLAHLPRHPQRKWPPRIGCAAELLDGFVASAADGANRGGFSNAGDAPRIGVSDLIEGGSRRGSGAGYEAPEGDMYWPDELLGRGTAENASRRAGGADGAGGVGGSVRSGGGLQK